MQTFLPYHSFFQSAYVLDNKRLGKQRVECKQILLTLGKEKTETVQRVQPDGTFRTIVRATPWWNHPAVRMWRGHEASLAAYGVGVCVEWRARGFKDSLMEFFLARMNVPCYLDATLPDKFTPEFHASHRSNLLRKDPIYYGQFCWKEPADLPYIWPV